MELSEQAVLVLTVIDTLPQLPLELLEEWLPLAAGLMNHVADASIKERCKEHFWSVLMDGEMSSHRSQACAAWWSTGGGRDMVLFGHERGEEEVLEMSGALPLEASHAGHLRTWRPTAKGVSSGPMGVIYAFKPNRQLHYTHPAYQEAFDGRSAGHTGILPQTHTNGHPATEELATTASRHISLYAHAPDMWVVSRCTGTK
ncbi:hypothetical protein LTS02_017382 [Friedmanniomyces endolithicus]|nr:hypothetical protein LTS02_017382 [Friedmanniomyces endolithicus]